jgi:hypothetical protein
MENKKTPEIQVFRLEVADPVQLSDTKAYIASLTKEQKLLIYNGLKSLYKLKELLDGH